MWRTQKTFRKILLKLRFFFFDWVDDEFDDELRLLLLLLLMPLVIIMLSPPPPLPPPPLDLWLPDLQFPPFVDVDPVVVVVMALSPDDSIASSKMRNEFSVELVGKLISDSDDESKLALGETRKNALVVVLFGTAFEPLADDDFFKRYHSHDVDSCGGLDLDDVILPFSDFVNGDLKKTGEDRRRAFLLFPSDFVSWAFFEAGVLAFACEATH